jgi:YfiH family protein
MNLLNEWTFGSYQIRTYDSQPRLTPIHCKQVHSNKIITYEGQSVISYEADGIINNFTTYPDRHIAIKTADCLPVFFIGKSQVAAVHAGWQGIKKGILIQDVLKTISVQDIFIGPSIHHYQVSESFKKEFPKSRSFYQKNKTLFFNLQAEALSQLTQYFPHVNIVTSQICTLHNLKYNSYRRNNTNQRNWNIISKNKEKL